MKSHIKSKIHAILPALILMLLPVAALAAGDSKSDDVDMNPELYEYLKKCQHNQDNPKIMLMLDTLYTKADKLGDRRTQAAALCEKAIHFINCPPTAANHDSVDKYTNIVKEFARETNQDRYYYWIWMRYAEYFLKHRQYNLALYELKSMEKEAEEQVNKDGIISAYKVLARIYSQKKNPLKAIEMQEKVIKISESMPESEKDFNISSSYSRLATYQLEAGKYEDARKNIEKGMKLARTDNQRAQALHQWVQYYYFTGDREKMQQAFDQLTALEHSAGMSEISCRYYIALADKQYGRAIELENKMFECAYEGPETHYIRMSELLEKIPGREKEALAYYKKYAQYTDSLNVAESNTNLEDITTIMRIQEIELDKKEMALKLETDKNKSLIAIVAAVSLLAIVLLFILHRVLRGRKIRLR